MKGMVVAPQPIAAEEGILALQRGGNAVDAAVTMALVQGVVDPLNCGIGGFGNMHIYGAERGEDVLLDFTSRAGSKATPDMWLHEILGPAADGVGFLLRNDVNELGYQAIGVPGTVRGLSDALARYGTQSWGDVLRPAIGYARQGYRVPAEQAAEWRVRYPQGRPDALARFTHTPAAATIYTRQGHTLDAGDLLVNADVSHTLELLAGGGADAYYRGQLGARIATDLEQHGSHITPADLQGYTSQARAPILGAYRGYSISCAPPPWAGVEMTLMFNILEQYDLRALGFNSVEYVHVVSQAMKAGFAVRNRYSGDPAFVDVPVERLISKAYAREWKDRIERGEPFDVGFDRSAEGPHTTHLCVADAAGNCVSLTHTLGYGSGVVTPGLGFLYNNFMVAFDPVPGGANSIAPGKMRRTGGSPTLVFHDGQPVLALGAPGGTRIVSAVLQTILNVLDHGMTIVEAVSAPRFDCQGETIQVEGRIPRWVCAGLEAKGHHVERDSASYGIYPTTAARVHALLLDRERDAWTGGADPRGYGMALTV